jgi:uncharacterized repeat protein (TIGR01451 family)
VVQGPSISKTFATSPVKVGERTELIVTVTNNANVALTGVALTDNLPPDLAVANPSDTGTTCAGGSVTALPGASKVSLAGATVPANNSCTFRAFVVASKAGSFLNTIGQNAITSQQGLTNGNPADAPLQVWEQPGISKNFTPAQIASGGTSTLRIRLDNANATPITLTDALVDALPGNVLVAAAPNINGNLAGATACPGVVTATAGAINLSYANGATIPAGGCTISVDVTSSVSGAYLNTIAAGQLKTNAGDNPDPANATLGVDRPAGRTHGEQVVQSCDHRCKRHSHADDPAGQSQYYAAHAGQRVDRHHACQCGGGCKPCHRRHLHWRCDGDGRRQHRDLC